MTVERFLIAYDIGRAINPMLVEGQLVGGFVQGLGGALYEEFRLRRARRAALSVTLADYLLPTAREVPPVEVLVTEDAPSPLNPLGIKSVGEGGITGVGAVHRGGDRRRDRHARRGDAAAGDAAADQERCCAPHADRKRPHDGPADLLNAPTLAAYTAAGFWGDETIYHLAARHARATPQAFAVRDRHRRLTYADAGRCRRPAGGASRRPRHPRRAARRRVAAEPGRDRDRAARLLAQRLCLLPVVASRPHGWRDRRAGRPHARRGADRPTRLRRRCRPARRLRRIGRPRLPALRLARRPGRRGAVRRIAGPGARNAGERRCQSGDVSALHLRHDRRAEGRYAQRQHAARHRANDGARLAAGSARALHAEPAQSTISGSAR